MLRDKLNAIMKPKVMWALFKLLWELRWTQGEELIIKDIPLLIEVGFFKHIMFPIICVSVNSDQIALKRLMNRNNLT